jgi:ketosteroid isomerase-like protein
MCLRQEPTVRVAALRSWVAGAVLTLAACCGDAGSAQASLMAADQSFSSHSAKHEFAAAFNEVAADDVVFLPERGAALKGKAAVEEALAAVPAGTVFSWTPQQAEVEGDGGYTWGVYELNGSNAAGQSTLVYGNYLSVWKKQAGGWRLQAMMLNQTPGPTG